MINFLASTQFSQHGNRLVQLCHLLLNLCSLTLQHLHLPLRVGAEFVPDTRFPPLLAER